MLQHNTIWITEQFTGKAVHSFPSYSLVIRAGLVGVVAEPAQAGGQNCMVLFCWRR
jgi:hypothetical protein